MSINTFRARTLTSGFYPGFNRHMQRDVLGRCAEEETEDIPPDLVAPARPPLWGIDEW